MLSALIFPISGSNRPQDAPAGHIARLRLADQGIMGALASPRAYCRERPSRDMSSLSVGESKVRWRSSR